MNYTIHYTVDFCFCVPVTEVDLISATVSLSFVTCHFFTVWCGGITMTVLWSSSLVCHGIFYILYSGM